MQTVKRLGGVDMQTVQRLGGEANPAAGMAGVGCGDVDGRVIMSDQICI